MIFFTEREWEFMMKEDKRVEQKKEANRRYWEKHRDEINRNRRKARAEKRERGIPQ